MIIAQMVGRNEADRYLKPVLEHLSNIADTICFTDDCSSDDGATIRMAEDFGCKITQTPEPLFTRHEGQLRQFAWQHLENHARVGDWVLAIDCDERLFGTQELEKFIDQSRYDVLGITFCHMWNETCYRVDKAWKPNLSSRLFRYKEGGEFLQRRLACGSEPTYVQEAIRQGRVNWNTPFVMQHLGYMADGDKLNKYHRYMELDGGDFHARAHIESIIDPGPTLMEFPYGG